MGEVVSSWAAWLRQEHDSVTSSPLPSTIRPAGGAVTIYCVEPAPRPRPPRCSGSSAWCPQEPILFHYSVRATSRSGLADVRRHALGRFPLRALARVRSRRAWPHATRTRWSATARAALRRAASGSCWAIARALLLRCCATRRSPAPRRGHVRLLTTESERLCPGSAASAECATAPCS